VPVGIRSIEFQTTVGARIAIEGKLNILSQAARGASYAKGDLLGGLHAEIAPAAGYQGVALSYESAPPPTPPPTGTTPPVVTLAQVPSNPSNDPTADFTFVSTESGSSFSCSLDNNPYAACNASFTTPALTDGSHTLEVKATDAAGNTSTTPATYTWTIDTNPPTLSLPPNQTVNATSPTGAVVTYSVSATDNADPNPSATCSPASGSTFAISKTTVSCTATDKAGNKASGTFTVTVKGAKEQLADLIQKILGASQLSPAAKTILVGQLQSLLASFDPNNATQRQTVCLALQVFKAAVQQQAGKAITQAQAAEWIADANRIRAVLGC
jgi:hypothetical protein